MSALPEAYLKLVLPLIDKARGFLEYGESLQPFAFVGMAGAAIQAEAETTGDEPGLQATLSGGHPIRPYYGLLGDELPVGRFDAPLAVRALLDSGSRKTRHVFVPHVGSIRHEKTELDSLVIVLTLAISRRSNTLAPVANLSVMQRAVAPPGLPIQK